MRLSWKKIQSTADSFFFSLESPVPLAICRIGIALVLLLQYAETRGDLFDLYGSEGVLQKSLEEFLMAPVSVYIFPALRIIERWVPLPGGEAQWLQLLNTIFLMSLLFFLVGFKTRTAAFFALLSRWLMIGVGYFSHYGVDRFTHIVLFYGVWMPMGHALSVDSRLHPELKRSSSLARLSLRTLQLHLCIAYFAAGTYKLMSHQWWNGDAIWRALMTAKFQGFFNWMWVPQFPWLAKILAWGTLLIETGYAVFLWIPETRYLWLALVISLHLGIALFIGLYSFSFAMIVLSLSAFCPRRWIEHRQQ